MLTEPKKIASNVTLYSTDPIIYVVSNFLSNEECQSFIDLGMGIITISLISFIIIIFATILSFIYQNS